MSFCSRMKNGDFGAISVTEQSSAAPISKVDRHIPDRFQSQGYMPLLFAV